MVIWTVLASPGKTADLVLACFGQSRKNSRFGTVLFWPVQEKQQIWYLPVLDSPGKTADLVLACFG